MVDNKLADVTTASQYSRLVAACCHSYFYSVCICFQTDSCALEATVLKALNYGVLSDCKLFHLWFLKQHTSSQTPAVSDCVPRHVGEVTRVNHLFYIGKVFQSSHLYIWQLTSVWSLKLNVTTWKLRKLWVMFLVKAESSCKVQFTC